MASRVSWRTDVLDPLGRLLEDLPEVLLLAGHVREVVGEGLEGPAEVFRGGALVVLGSAAAAVVPAADRPACDEDEACCE